MQTDLKSENQQRNLLGQKLCFRWKSLELSHTINKEFDPGSGRTLAARLTHASRTELIFQKFSDGREISLVADG